MIYIWDVNSCTHLHTFRGHKAAVTVSHLQVSPCYTYTCMLYPLSVWVGVSHVHIPVYCTPSLCMGGCVTCVSDLCMFHSVLMCHGG